MNPPYGGKIYYWDRRNEPLSEAEYLEDFGSPRPEEAMMSNMHLVADSFSEFVDRLQIRPVSLE